MFQYIPTLDPEGFANAPMDPAIAEIRPTEFCQLNCVGCWYYGEDATEEFKNRKKVSLSSEVFLKTLGSLKAIGFRSLIISGGGDPLAHPKIYDFLEAAVAHKFRVFLFSNLLLCRDPDRLAKSGISQVCVNFSAADADSYVRFHPNQKPESFARLLDVIAKLRGNMEVWLLNVVSSQNYRRIGDMIRTASTVSDSFLLKNLRDSRFAMSEAERLEVKEALPEYRRLADSLGLRHNLKKYDPLIDGAPPIHLANCYAGDQRTVIQPDGSVVFCCMNGSEKFPIGNVNTTSMETIWRSPEYAAMRKKFRSRQLEKFCEGCIHFKENYRLTQIYRQF